MTSGNGDAPSPAQESQTFNLDDLDDLAGRDPDGVDEIIARLDRLVCEGDE
jgi:hypothetical protein